MTTAPRWIAYEPLDGIVGADRNPKRHDPSIAASLSRFGYVEAITVDERTGRLVAGHGRVADLRTKHAAGEDPPEGVTVDDEGRWLVPVQHGWASTDDQQATAYLVASNQTTIAGGWDPTSMAPLLAEIENLSGIGFTEADVAMFERLAQAYSDAPASPDDVWRAAGMADPNNGDLSPAISVHVSLASEADFDEFRARLGYTGPRRTRVWFPEQPDLVESGDELVVPEP